MIRYISILLFFLLSSANMHAADILKSDAGITCAWNAEDVIGIYTSAGSRIKCWVETIDSDSRWASLTAPGWSLVDNASYSAYYPYTSAYVENGNTPDSLPISYSLQTQMQNDDVAHLSSYDFLTAHFQTADQKADIVFDHLGALLSFDITMPEYAVITSLTLSLDTAMLITEAAMNLKATPTGVKAVETAKEFTLTLGNIAVSNVYALKAYMMLPPVDMSGKVITLTLTDDRGEKYLTTLKGTSLKAGYIYPVVVGSDNESSQSAKAIYSVKKKSPVSSLVSPVAVIKDMTVDTENIIEVEKPIASSISRKVMDDDCVSGSAYSLGGIKYPETYQPQKSIIVKKGRKYIKK